MLIFFYCHYIMSLQTDQYGLFYRPWELAKVQHGRVNMKQFDRPPLGSKQGLTRNGFRRATILPRGVVGRIEAIQALDEKMNGKKISLSDKTLKDMFEVQVPDPEDKNYDAQGRTQRTITKKVNFGQVSKNLNTQLATISTAVAQGRTESESDRATMLLQLTSLLGSITTLETLTANQFDIVTRGLDALNIPKNWQPLFPKRFWTWSQFNTPAYTGLIVAFLLSNIPNKSVVAQHYKRVRGSSGSKDPDDYTLENIGVDKVFSILRAGEQVLDLQDRVIVPKWVSGPVGGLPAPGGPIVVHETPEEEKGES